eukprot:COSAG05_NODE_227_length_13407_cov_32.277953_14_plen_265_part_00
MAGGRGRGGRGNFRGARGRGRAGRGGRGSHHDQGCNAADFAAPAAAELSSGEEEDDQANTNANVARAPPRKGGKGFRLERTILAQFARSKEEVEAARLRKEGAELRRKVELALSKQKAAEKSNVIILAQQQELQAEHEAAAAAAAAAEGDNTDETGPEESGGGGSGSGTAATLSTGGAVPGAAAAPAEPASTTRKEWRRDLGSSGNAPRSAFFKTWQANPDQQGDGGGGVQQVKGKGKGTLSVKAAEFKPMSAAAAVFVPGGAG